MLPKYIRTYQNLVTEHSDTVRGFLEQSLHKTKQAEPYVKRAILFSQALKNLKIDEDIFNLYEYWDEIVAACGYSDKSKSYFTHSELKNSIKAVLTNLLNVNPNGFKDELVYRYLITKGDTVGGIMRNLGGALAGRKVIQRISEALINKKITPELRHSKTNKVQGLRWNNRILLFDIKPKLINKNIDLILLDTSNQSDTLRLLLEEKNYIACGELKGGIDPAGADEHWKTANSALGRIRLSLLNSKPKLFFIGAAIQNSMAEEIFKQLETGELTHAANLNKDNQLGDTVEWLINL